MNILRKILNMKIFKPTQKEIDRAEEYYKNMREFYKEQLGIKK